MTGDMCSDDRFELIEKAKTKLLECTNVESRPEELAVLDSILFRCWQMGWLDQLREAATLDTEINGETSDGYHTFNELYHHRAVLFSVVVAANSGRAWKSKLHNDGTMYEGMFIVGVDTPQGQATYHYDVEPYWDMFWCRELERAPEWDGHTSDEAIERIGSLRDVVLKVPRGRW